jgi:hypothetical protein
MNTLNMAEIATIYVTVAGCGYGFLLIEDETNI